MDNDTYDDRHSRQQICNMNIIKRLEELEDKTANKVNDQLDIKLIKKEELHERMLKQCSGLADVVAKLDGKILDILKRLEDLEDLEDFTQTASQKENARFNIKIKALEDFQAQTIEFYSNT
jgi:hypothetical protein